MARKSNRVRIYKPPKSRRGWKYSKGKKPKKRKQVVLESKMIQRHTTGQISNEISPSWTQTQSERDTRTMLSTVDHVIHQEVFMDLYKTLSPKRFFLWLNHNLWSIHNVFTMQELIKQQWVRPNLVSGKNSPSFSIRNAVFFTTR